MALRVASGLSTLAESPMTSVGSTDLSRSGMVISAMSPGAAGPPFHTSRVGFRSRANPQIPQANRISALPVRGSVPASRGLAKTPAIVLAVTLRMGGVSYGIRAGLGLGVGLGLRVGDCIEMISTINIAMAKGNAP